MADSAWLITSRLIAGPVLYTGLGWLISRWVGHQALLMAIGALVGLGLAFYMVFSTLAREQRADGSRRG
jgi:F0F1-type ATP synthase assembly protein I